jgi:endonuclease/exonuclease/phosphatase family metal-dependent hydrolase
MPIRLLAFALALSGCLRHALPVERSIESTAPPRRAAAGALPRTIRIATFNVHGKPAPELASALHYDPVLARADVIFLQEVKRIERPGTPPCSSACGIGKLLGYHVAYAPAQSMKEGSQGIAILSRAPILSSEVIELPYFDVVFNTAQRIALAATIDVAGTPVTVYSVHLENRLTVGDRRKHILPLLEHAQGQRTPVIIAGDVNTTPFTWLWHVIPIPTGTQDDRLEELVREHGFSTPVIHSGPTHEALHMKVDAIYTRGFATKRFAVTQAYNVSDHFALWADVTL